MKSPERGSHHSFDEKGLLADECFSHADKIWIIDREDMDRGSTDGRSASKRCASPLEVFIPGVCTRMEQSCKFPRVWVSPR